MRRSLWFLLPAAALATVAAMLWPQREPSLPIELAPPVELVERAAPRVPDLEPPDAAPPAVGAAVGTEPSPSPRIATVRAGLSEYLRARSGPPIAKSLVASGLSGADAERIAARFSLDVADCMLEGLRFDADARSESFDDVLAGLEMSLAGTDVAGGDVIDVERLERVEAVATPCAFDAMQRAGIALPGAR